MRKKISYKKTLLVAAFSFCVYQQSFSYNSPGVATSLYGHKNFQEYIVNQLSHVGTCLGYDIDILEEALEDSNLFTTGSGNGFDLNIVGVLSDNGEYCKHFSSSTNDINGRITLTVVSSGLHPGLLGTQFIATPTADVYGATFSPASNHTEIVAWNVEYDRNNTSYNFASFNIFGTDTNFFSVLPATNPLSGASVS